jgi:transcriptional regulator with XRE-family HTH domain
MQREAKTMSIYFSEKFKQLRKDKDLTQEQIADIFHVSPQSVSRWETGANYPDVEMLPHLAIFFKVTLDELLGTDKILGEEKAGEYVRDILNLLNSGKVYDAIDTARKAAKEYPFHYGLQGRFVEALCAACDEGHPDAKENTEKFKNEIITACERLIKYNPEHAGHKYQLFHQYVKWGMKEEAKKILHTMPSEIWFTQDANSGYVQEGEEWRKGQQVRMIRTMVMLCHFIGEYSSKVDLSPLEKIECLKMGGQIQKIIAPITSDAASSFHDNPENEDCVDSAFQNVRIAGLYCEAGDAQNALDYVEKAAQNAMRHIEQMDTTNSDGSNYMAWSTPRNLPWILWEDHLSKPQFDLVRGGERFVECFELLKANSRELK